MTYELVIVGAGISGLSAALTAHEAGLENVLILDYEKQRGGFASPLFGSEAFAEERRLTERAARLPYDVFYKTSVTGFFPGEDGGNHQLLVQTPEGAKTVEASRVLLCSGSLEKPREGNWIAGSRPAGVMTPVMAIQLLKRGYVPGERVLVMDTGRLSRAAAELLEKAGLAVERLSGDLWEVHQVEGLARLSAVQVRERAAGRWKTVECDTLVFSRQRIPCTFYLKGSPVERDERQAIRVDESGRTNIAGVYAAGTCTDRGDDEHLGSIEAGRHAMNTILHERG